MGFHRIGQDWTSKRLYGDDAGEPVLIRSGSWCWVEERDGESGLTETGECLVIEDAVMLEDGEGNEIPGGLRRATMWEGLAKRHGLEIPQHLKARRPKRRRSTKTKGADAPTA
jgi:hypothetical protein